MNLAPHNNPVGRAVRRQLITRAARNFSLRVYLLHEGEAVTADAVAVAKVLATAIGVLGLQDVDSGPGLSVMRDGLSALIQLSERGFIWHARDAGAMDAALSHAVLVLTSAPSALVQRAWIASEIKQ